MKQFVEVSKEHLKKSCIDYVDHLKWAVSSGVQLIGLGLASIVHGFVPSLFEATAGKAIIRIFYRQLYNHPNPEYRQLITEEFKKTISND
jgi:hypothetical protein